MPFAQRNGTRLYWRLDGNPAKPVLFLLNAIGTDLALWDGTMAHLLRDFHVLRMDFRGHGASDVPDGPYALQDLAADAVAVMDAARIKHAAICGLSLGGMVATTLALEMPGCVDALVLACTSANMDRDTWQARIDGVVSDGMAAVADMAMERLFSARFRDTHPDVAESYRSNLVRADPNGYVACCAAIRDMDLLPRLGAISVPTLVLAGAKDIATPFETHGAKMAARISGAGTVRIAAGHLACVEAPAAFANVVADFLTQRPGKADAGTAAAVLYEAGLRIRRRVLGDEWVDHSLSRRTAFNAEFQEFITRAAWQEIWSRPGLDERTRRLLVIAMTASLSRWEEFRLHVRAGLERDAFTADELKEVLMQTAIYAGVPAANTAFNESAAILEKILSDG